MDLLRILSLALALQLSGCARILPYIKRTPAKPVAQAEAPVVAVVTPQQAAAPDGERDPVKVNVVQTFAEGQRLRVKVQLTAEKELATNELVLALLGLENGEVIGRTIVPLSELYSEPTLAAGRPIAVLLTAPLQEVSEFQVVCSWGEDGKRLMKDRPAVADADGVVLERVNIQVQARPCMEPPCADDRYLVATLKNNSPAPQASLKLAVGVVFVPEGELAPAKDPREPLDSTEQLVELPGVTLEPQQSQDLRIRFDRPLPDVVGGSFVPTVRIVSPGATG